MSRITANPLPQAYLDKSIAKYDPSSNLSEKSTLVAGNNAKPSTSSKQKPSPIAGKSKANTAPRTLPVSKSPIPSKTYGSTGSEGLDPDPVNKTCQTTIDYTRGGSTGEDGLDPHPSKKVCTPKKKSGGSTGEDGLDPMH